MATLHKGDDDDDDDDNNNNNNNNVNLQRVVTGPWYACTYMYYECLHKCKFLKLSQSSVKT